MTIAADPEASYCRFLGRNFPSARLYPTAGCRWTVELCLRAPGTVKRKSDLLVPAASGDILLIPFTRDVTELMLDILGRNPGTERAKLAGCLEDFGLLHRNP